MDATRARLLPSCNLLVVHGSNWGKSMAYWQQQRNTVREYDWEGDVVWEYRAPRVVHHDVQRLSNGNTIFLQRASVLYDVARGSWEEVDSFEGLSKKELADSNKRKVQSDVVVEVDSSGKVVWEFALHEHLDVKECGKLACKNPADSKRWLGQPRDWTHTNTVSVIPENKWFDRGDERFRPGNIMIMPRSWWRAYVIDKKTKKLVWQYDGEYDGGLLTPHEVHMIEKGFPGAGNVLIFDNGTDKRRNHSVALEIDPSSKKAVWAYHPGNEFYSRAAGSLQRLANGNCRENVPAGASTRY